MKSPRPLAASPVAAYPQLGRDGLILEGVVTTLNADGTPRISPMGPIVDRSLQRILFRPYRTSKTLANLLRNGQGVLHVTDDVELIARAACHQLETLPPVEKADAVEGVVLVDACRWFAFSVEHIDDSAERTAVYARTVAQGDRRPFFGLNRAKHAVVEAAILATRLQWLAADDVDAALTTLAVLIEKTASQAERDAFEFVVQYIRSCESS